MTDSSNDNLAPRSLSFRLSNSINSHINTTAPRRLTDNINHMLNSGIAPLLDRPPNLSIARLFSRSPSNPPSHPQSATMNQPGPNRDSYVINMDALQPASSDRLAPSLENMPSPNNNNEANGTRSDNNPTAETSASDILSQNPELRFILSYVEQYIPFVLILLVKLIFDHKAGLLILVGLVITFSNANSIVKREVGKQAKRNIKSLAAVTINLVTCIVFIYYAFDSNQLYLSLALLPPKAITPFTTWDLLWVVSVTDFVIKLITVLIKIGVIVLPPTFVPFQKKGKYYLFIEQTSQFYRCAIPVVPWLYFLILAYEGISSFFGMALVVTYVITKSKDIFHKAKSWRSALGKLMQNVSYGSRPSREQIEAVGNMCPICQDDLQQPTMLSCNHIFCEECVTMWFDRERTCPMCREKVADDPSWRDGSTTYFVQLF